MKNYRVYIIGLFIVLLVALGTLSYTTIKTVNQVTENVSLVINHPYPVSKAANEAINTLHHLIHENPEEIEFTQTRLLESIRHMEGYIPLFDSLNAIIHQRYLGPELDLHELDTHLAQFKIDIADIKNKATISEESGADLYLEMIKEVSAIERALVTINEFANSKRDAIQAESLEKRQAYLYRLQVYILLMISIFIGVTAFIGITVRQKLRLTTENVHLSEKALKNTERIKRINKIFEYSATSEQEFLDYALDQAVALTESKLGCFYFYNDEKEEFTLSTCSKNGMKDPNFDCPGIYNNSYSTGSWVKAVRERKPVIINDFKKFHPSSNSHQSGYLNLERYMTAPIYKNNKVVAVIAVANKERNYSQDDLTQMQLLMNQVWNVNKARIKELENERFVRAVTESPLSIVITDVEGNIEYVNDYFTQISGYSQEEVIGCNPRILKSNTQDEEFYKQLWGTILSGKTWKGEFQNKSKKGNLFWELATISPIKDDEGKITSFVAVKEDITIRKLLLQNISYNERFKDSIFASMEEGLIVQDKDLNTLVANKSACEIFEMSLQTMKTEGPWNEHWQALTIDGTEIPPEEFPAKQVITKARSVENFIVNLVNGEDKSKYLSISSRPILNEEDEVIQAVSTFRDITELVESNQALLASEKKYRDVFELSADPSMILKNGIFVDVNDASVELFGCYDKEQLIGKNPIELSPDVQSDNKPTSVHYVNVMQTLERNGSHRFEWIHKKLNGICFPAEVMLTKINENGNTFIHVVLRDISNRKAQEQIILEQLQEKDMLLAEIHHRVKNNMAVVSGLIQLEVFQSDNKKVNNVLNKTVSRIKSIANIHEQIYKSTDLRHISMVEMIELLVRDHVNELRSIREIDLPVTLRLLDDVPINVNQALPFGLLLDELLINYLQLVKDDNVENEFSIVLFQNTENVHLVLNLTGDSLDTAKIYENLDRTLIDVFVKQLGGEISFTHLGELKTEIIFELKEVNGTVAHRNY